MVSCPYSTVHFSHILIELDNRIMKLITYKDVLASYLSSAN